MPLACSHRSPDILIRRYKSYSRPSYCRRHCSRTKRPRPVGVVSSGLLVRVRNRACPSNPIFRSTHVPRGVGVRVQLRSRGAPCIAGAAAASGRDQSRYSSDRPCINEAVRRRGSTYAGSGPLSHDGEPLYVAKTGAAQSLAVKYRRVFRGVALPSAQAGPKVAAILSVVESCRRLGVPVQDYLSNVLPGLNRRTLSEVANLTPARWSLRRG